eukprot:gene19339-25203_t
MSTATAIFNVRKLLLFDQQKDKLTKDNNDFISNIFAKFFPTPEDIGLTRYTKDSRPENFPCVKDEWANLLPEDKLDDVKLIRQLLAKTNLETRPLQILYDSNVDGWKRKVFHERVDKKGPAIVLCRSKKGGVFGGYNPTGWVNYGEYRGSIAAFLYVFPNNNIKARPIKLAKISGAGLAQIDDGGGPKFGSEGLTIAMEPNNPKAVRSRLGLYYEKLPNGDNTLLPDKSYIDELIEFKVFGGIYESNEKIPYSDALPFALN